MFDHVSFESSSSREEEIRLNKGAMFLVWFTNKPFIISTRSYRSYRSVQRVLYHKTRKRRNHKLQFYSCLRCSTNFPSLKQPHDVHASWKLWEHERTRILFSLGQAGCKQNFSNSELSPSWIISQCLPISGPIYNKVTSLIKDFPDYKAPYLTGVLLWRCINHETNENINIEHVISPQL